MAKLVWGCALGFALAFVSYSVLISCFHSIRFFLVDWVGRNIVRNMAGVAVYIHR